MRACAFIGRVGVLAVALGIGAAAASGATGWASPPDSSSSDSAGGAGTARGPRANGGSPEAAQQAPSPSRRRADSAAAARVPINNDDPSAGLLPTPPKAPKVPVAPDRVPVRTLAATAVPVRVAAAPPTTELPATAVTAPPPAEAVAAQARPGDVQSVLDSLFGNGPAAPTEGPLGWMVLAATRRRTPGPQPVPAAATASTPVLYIADFAANAVIAVDTVTYTTKKITDGIGRAPAGLAVNPAGTLALVPNMGDSTVSVLDTAKGVVTKVIPVSKNPVNVTFNSDGSRAYVISQGGAVNGVPESGVVSVIDMNASGGPALTSTKYVVGAGPAGAAVFGNRLYVVNNAGDSVSLIDITTGTVKTVPVGYSPQAVAFSKDGAAAYVTNAGDYSISVIDTATGQLKSGAIPMSRSPWAVAVAPSGKVVVTNLDDNSVTVLTGNSLNISTPIPISGMPGQVAVSAAGDFAYVSHGAGSAPAGVAIIDLAQNKVVKDVAVGVSPGGLAVVAGIAAPPAPTLPTVAIASSGGGSVSDGKQGTTTPAVFTVTLSSSPASEVKVTYTAQDATARAGRDFTATTGTLTFAKGTTSLSQTISVPVIGNAVSDGTRTFSVVLSNPSQATLATAAAQFSILDDDASSAVGGLSSVPIAATWPGRTSYEVRNNSAFAALRDDGSVVTWGDKAYGGDSTSVAALLADPKKPVTQIYSSKGAFAALRSDGSVVTWGSTDSGGNSTAVSTKLADPAKPVVQIYSTDGAFAALRSDGSVVTWGSSLSGGDSSGVASLLTGALLPAGATGDPAADSRKIVSIVSTGSAFAALSKGGSVVTWGADGGDSSKVTTALTDTKNPVIAISSTKGAFAALRSDGSVVTWGRIDSFTKTPTDYGADSSSVAAQLSDRSKPVTKIYSNGLAFAALRSDGSVVTWGSKASGGGSSIYTTDSTGAAKETSVADQLAGGVTAIYATNSAFAALKSDGTVVTWGALRSGGTSGTQLKNVDKIVATDSAFAAMLKDSSVVTWGWLGQSLLDATTPNADVGKQALNLYANGSAFAALLKNGSVVTWGSAGYGGDSTAQAVATKIRGVAVNTNPVTDVFTTGTAFAVLLKDKTVVTWGNAAAGGDSSSVASLLTRVVSFADPFRDDRLGSSANVAPTITKAVPGTANSNGTTSATVNATDLNGDAMTMAATVAATLGTVTVASPTKPGEWTFTFTALNDSVRHGATKIGAVSTAPVTVTVTDAKGASTSQVIPVAIAPLNKVPEWKGTYTKGVPASDTGVVTGTISGLSDPDKDTLTYAVDPRGTATGFSAAGGSVVVTDNKNGTINYTYTPTAEIRRSGSTKDTFTVIVSDGYGGSLSIPIPVTVSTQANNPPQAGTPYNVVTDPVTGRVSGYVGATDPDRDTLKYTAAPASKPLTSAKGAIVTVDDTGKFTYSPTDPMRREAVKLGGDPTDTFTVTVTDSRGASTQIKVPVKILGKNNPLTGTGKVTELKTDAISGEVTGKITGVTGAETGETIVYSGAADRITTTATSAKGGTATVYSDGRFSYKPTADMRTRAATATDKSDTFTVFALDGYGSSVAVPVKVEIAAPPTYDISPSVTTINEGETLITTVKTTGVKAGTTLYWSVFKKLEDGSRWDMKILGVLPPGGDFSNGATEGSGTVGSDGKFTFTHTLSNDVTVDEGEEQFQIALYSDAARKNEVKATPFITVKDTSKSIFDKSFVFRGTDWRGEEFKKLYGNGSKSELSPENSIISYNQVGRMGVVRLTSKFFKYFGTAQEQKSTILEHSWDPGRPTIVYSHGWKDSAGLGDLNDPNLKDADPNSQSQLLFNALHERYGATHNILLVDWRRLAENSEYPGPLGLQPIAEITVTKQVGETVAEALLQAGVKPSQLTLIGHSLGSYVMSAAADYIKRKTKERIAQLVGLDPAFGLGYDIDARNGYNGTNFSFGTLPVPDPVILFTTDIAVRTRTYTASDLMENGKVAGDNTIAASAEKRYLVQYSKTDFELKDTADVAAAYHNAVIGVYADLVRKGIEDPSFAVNPKFDVYGKPNSAGLFDGVIVAAQPWITKPSQNFRLPKAIGWTNGYVGITIMGSPKSDVMYHDRFDKGNSFDWSDNGSISPKGTNLDGGGGDDFLVGDDPSDYRGIDQLWGGAGKDTFVFGYRRYGKDFKPYVDKNPLNPVDSGENSYAVIKDFNPQEDRLQFSFAKDQLVVESYGKGVRLRYADVLRINNDLFAEIQNLSYDDAMTFLNSSKTTYSKVYDLDVNLFQNK